MTIAGMIKSSLIDYPGLITCVLFAPGCNFDCFYCHNRGLIDGAYGALDQTGVMEFLKNRSGLLDAVTVSGGEPTLQRDLIEFIRQVKTLGYKLKLDTNGSDTETVEKLLDLRLCDYFAVDYKAPRSRCREICGDGADPDAVLETIGLLARRGADFEVRTTVIPQLGLDDLLTMARELPVLPRYVLNRYRKPDVYKPCDRNRIDETPYTQAQIDTFALLIKDIQPGSVVGG
jgi:pyruvate formate lyase activating enzyme